MAQENQKPPSAGVESVIDILNQLDEDARKRLLADLARQDPNLAQRVEAGLFGFSHLLKLEDPSLQLILREVPVSTLALALRGAPPEVKAPIFKNLSSRAGQALQEEIDGLGPRKLTDVKIAQEQVVGIAKNLEQTGKVKLLRKQNL